MRVLVVLLHACFSVVVPIPFLLAAIFLGGHPYIGSITVLADMQYWGDQASVIALHAYRMDIHFYRS